MLLPMIPEIPQDRRYLQEFKGYNRHERVGEGEFTDICNMSNDEYPVLTTRAKRYELDKKFAYVAGMVSLDGHLYVLGLSTEDAAEQSGVESENIRLYFYKDGEKRDAGALQRYALTGFSPRQLVVNGMYILCFPDKLYYNASNDEIRPMEEIFFSFGHSYTRVEQASGEWTPNANGNYLAVSYNPSSEFGDSFHMYDTVDVVETEYAGFQYLKDGISHGSFVVADITDDHRIIIQDDGSLENSYNPDHMLWLVRRIPDMDYVTAVNNKLYGVKYGNGEGGTTISSVYISSGADIFDFSVNTQAYSAAELTVGEAGEFTGIAPFSGSVYAFKRDCAIRISGTYPNVSTQILHVPGVAKGAEKSIAYHDGYLYYKGEMGVYRFNGEYATLISDAFGARRYTGGVGAFLGDKYYLALSGNPSDEKIEKVTGRKLNTGGILGPIAALINMFVGLAGKIKGFFLSLKFPLFVFDVARGTWQLETLSGLSTFGTQLITDMTYSEGVLFAARVDGTIDAIADSKPQYESSTIEPDFDWWCQTGYLGYDSPDEKHVGRILIRLRLKQTTEVDFKIRYDDAEEWESVARINDVGIKTVVVPIIPRRCDVYQIRIEGKGECKIYGVTTTLEGGSDVQWHL